MYTIAAINPETRNLVRVSAMSRKDTISILDEYKLANLPGFAGNVSNELACETFKIWHKRELQKVAAIMAI